MKRTFRDRLALAALPLPIPGAGCGDRDLTDLDVQRRLPGLPGRHLERRPGRIDRRDSECRIAGNNDLMYTSLDFVGIEFISQSIDASQIAHFHLDVFAPMGTNFRVEVIAFDDDDGNVVDEKELAFDETTIPAFFTGEWSSLDIPLEDYQLGSPRDHIGQLAPSTADAQLVLVDNVCWY